MESLIRLVSQSLARQGLDRPRDYRGLQWSHWFRCESHHSLLVVPSKPGVFAIAEEVTDLESSTAQVEAAGSPALSAVNEAEGSGSIPEAGSQKPQARRMLAVRRFFEDDDMASVLDHMLSHQNPMRARLACGRFFVRFVVIEDPVERRSVSNALNQWILCSAEKAAGAGSQFATSLELIPEPPSLNRTQAPESAHSTRIQESGNERVRTSAPTLNSAIATTIHCSSSFPAGL